MSGPGAYEPPEEYVPAAIEGVIDEKALPTEPAAGEDELWLVQVPGDVNPADFQGLRFKLTGEGAGADVAAFKAGGATPRDFPVHHLPPGPMDSPPFPRPSRAELPRDRLGD